MAFTPFRLANGSVCCSDEHALCDTCKSKHAARTHRSASTPPLRLLAECPPPDAYAIDAAKLRAANERSERVPDYAAIRATSTIHLDVNGVPDGYHAETTRMREENAR